MSPAYPLKAPRRPFRKGGPYTTWVTHNQTCHADCCTVTASAAGCGQAWFTRILQENRLCPSTPQALAFQVVYSTGFGFSGGRANMCPACFTHGAAQIDTLHLLHARFDCDLSTAGLPLLTFSSQTIQGKLCLARLPAKVVRMRSNILLRQQRQGLHCLELCLSDTVEQVTLQYPACPFEHWSH